MSLRTVPRDVVTVQNYLETRGTSGQLKHVDPDGPPLTVRCNAYPLSSSELDVLGLVNEETYRLYLHFETWPGNQWSRIVYDGFVWEQVGPAVQYRAGRASQNTQVTIRKRGTANG